MNISNSKFHDPPSAPYNCGNNLAHFDGELYLIKKFYRLPESDQLFAVSVFESTAIPARMSYVVSAM
jgi:hypothetical protein